ncbi:sigma-70 family RNA polymerase sigma factor [Priestia filamentosa]|uniref:sigma-70 family RNA polymerase sigma factor n=1 Tax=Priestia filamentosa TaxID=1402861 RepID=UPI001FB55729|nr:sigma-70 family RNA polymerase sigma factor [Priestia filamentosa]MED3725709.1 sigma-70 family RNA polymerase sigma factor [Priestia filamentosa]UOE61053.1 sigma-70 family RNA polymerase sigma factor [Priestia filamentosa]
MKPFHSLPNNSLLKHFFSSPSHQRKFENYQQNPSKQTKKELDQAFKCFYEEVRLVAYFSRFLSSEAITFKKKIQKYEYTHSFILDKPVFENNREPRINMIKDDSFFNYYHQHEEHIEECITNEYTYHCVKMLTKREKTVLYLHFYVCLTNVEIAQKLAVSPQAISKMKKNALKKLRRSRI